MRTTFLFLLVCFTIAGHAQQARQFSFRHFSTLNGLASNMVSTVLQDHDGFIWMATQNGLQRYDGSNFITFRNHSNDPSTIPSNHISFMYEDSKENLWLIGDNNKVGVFDTRRFVFTEVPVSGRQYSIYMPQHLAELPGGEMFLMQVDGEYFRYDPHLKRFMKKPGALPVPAGWRCTHFAWDSISKKLWMGCDSGLALYNPATKNINYRGHNPDNDPAIKSLANTGQPFWTTVTAEGNLLFCCWPPYYGAPVIHRFEKATNRADTFFLGYKLGYHEINGFLQQKKGRLWVFGSPFLAEWTSGKDAFSVVAYKYTRGAQFEYAFNAFEDKEGNIWMATDNGVYYFSPDEQIFNSFSLLRPGGSPMQLNVTAAQELDNGSVLVGTWGGRLLLYDQQFNPLPLPASLKDAGEHYSVWDMAINAKTHDVWMALQGGFLSVYSQKTGRLVEMRPAIFQNSTIRQVDEDTSGNLWFGTQSGRVIKWDIKKSGGDPTKGYELILQTGLVQKIHFDYQGFVWVGALGKGLLKIDVKTKKLVKTFTTAGKEGERLFNDTPYDMSWYDDSTLVVTAGCINVVNTKTNKVRFITADDGLPSNNTVSVQKDKYGVLWVGLSNGICRVNLSKNVISFYDRRDGIAYDKLVPAGVGHLSDGRIIFFTEHDFLVFDPQKFGQTILPPRPFVTSFKLRDQFLSMDSLSRLKRVVLRYNNTSIAVGFSALRYLQQRKLHYLYKMDGLDKDWIHSDHPIEAIYNSLPPGDYVFKVKSENADGMSSEEEAWIPLTVRPPFWQTWWFYSLIGLAGFAVFYLVDTERVKRRKLIQTTRQQIRANLKDEVSATLNNINVLSEIAKIKADKNVSQAKDFIGQITDKSRYMNEVMDDTLWSIDPANDSMKKFVLRIKELTEGLQASHDIGIDLIVDHKVQTLELNMKLRYELLFFYKEAMNFIIENTRFRQVFVNINKTRSQLYLEILAEGQGQHELKQMFVKAVQKRVAALSASLDVLADNKSFSAVLFVNV